LGSLGRLGWLVIGTFHASLLIGADLYLAGPSVESVRHGGADGRHLISENSRHSRCDDEGSRDDGHGHGVFHFAEYALRSTRFPAQYCAIRNVRHGLPPANEIFDMHGPEEVFVHLPHITATEAVQAQ